MRDETERVGLAQRKICCRSGEKKREREVEKVVRAKLKLVVIRDLATGR